MFGSVHNVTKSEHSMPSFMPRVSYKQSEMMQECYIYGVACSIEHTKLIGQNKRTLEEGRRDVLANHLICGGKKLTERRGRIKIMMFFWHLQLTPLD
jgi:hypothetical protein